jgi:hypothetical protein
MMSLAASTCFFYTSTLDMFYQRPMTLLFPGAPGLHPKASSESTKSPTPSSTPCQWRISRSGKKRASESSPQCPSRRCSSISKSSGKSTRKTKADMNKARPITNCKRLFRSIIDEQRKRIQIQQACSRKWRKQKPLATVNATTPSRGKKTTAK